MDNSSRKLNNHAANITSFMEEILRKYNLEKKQEALFNSAISARGTEQSGKLFNQLPSFKIIKIIEKLDEKEISEKDLPAILEAELEIDHKTAKEISQEISMKGIKIYQAWGKRDVEKTESKKSLKTLGKISLEKETTIPLKTSLEKPITPPRKSEKIPSKEPGARPPKDTYREMPTEEELHLKF